LKEKKRINHLGPKRPLSSFGPDVVGLQWLVASINVGVGVGVVTADGDGVVVVVEGVVIDSGGGLHIGAGFERTIRIKSENDDFCESEGRVRFFKNNHF
jgi:hypothetical protein